MATGHGRGMNREGPLKRIARPRPYVEWFHGSVWLDLILNFPKRELNACVMSSSPILETGSSTRVRQSPVFRLYGIRLPYTFVVSLLLFFSEQPHGFLCSLVNRYKSRIDGILDLLGSQRFERLVVCSWLL